MTTGTADLNPDDDIASPNVTVVAPTADLALSLADSPDPVSLASYLTYTITVSNLGPATATGVVASNTLPPTAALHLRVAGGITYTMTAAGQLVVTFTNLGNLASGAQTNLTITVLPAAAGTITDTASCRSDVVDPLKANNAATVKTIVQAVPLPLKLAQARGSLAMSWPAYAGYFLESTTDLRPPAVWVPATDAQMSLVGGQIVAIVPVGPGNKFFRLNWSSSPASLPLSVTHAGTSVIVAWPANLWNLNLESTTTLTPPVVWSPVTSPVPSLANGLSTVTLPVGGAGQFFRLHGTTP